MGNHHRCRRRHGNGNNPCRSRSRLPYYYGLLSSVQSGTDTAASSERDRKTQNMEVMAVDLSSMASTASFADRIVERHLPVSLLMNNAGTMETGLHITDDGFERTVSVNYLGPYLLTRKLLPALTCGARIVNMVSCTYAIGHLDFPDFFRQGRKGSFWRIPVYSNTKLALMLFTIELSERLREKGSLSMPPIPALFLPTSSLCTSGLTL